VAQAVQRSSIDATYLRTLRKAALIAGGEAKLALAWSVAPEQLAIWLAGEVVLPVDFYIAALGIIERGEA
jgi:hypothetical protein